MSSNFCKKLDLLELIILRLKTYSSYSINYTNNKTIYSISLNYPPRREKWIIFIGWIINSGVFI